MKITNKKIEVKPYSITELAQIYQVSIHIIRKWLNPHSEAIGKKNGRMYTILQVKIIFEKLDIPGTLDD
jgi:transposase